jgi:hypothetical protein
MNSFPRFYSFSTYVRKQNQTMWGRWCLSSFNKNCNQNIKGTLADNDNHLCDGKTLKVKVRQEEINPWEHPTLLTYTNGYGF